MATTKKATKVKRSKPKTNPLDKKPKKTAAAGGNGKTKAKPKKTAFGYGANEKKTRRSGKG